METSTPDPPAHFNYNVHEPILDLDVYIHHYFSRDEHSFVTKTLSTRPLGCSPKEHRYRNYSGMWRVRNLYSEIRDEWLSERYGDMLCGLMRRAGYFHESPDPPNHNHSHHDVPENVSESVARFVMEHPELKSYWHFIPDCNSPKDYESYKSSQEFINVKYLEYAQVQSKWYGRYEKQKKMCPYL